MNSLKCPKSKSLSHCLTELFPIYQNKQWTIRQQDNCSVDPSSHRIILKIVGYQLLWFRRYNLHQNQNFDIKYHNWDSGANCECTASLAKWIELVSKELNHFGVIADLFQQIGGHSSRFVLLCSFWRLFTMKMIKSVKVFPFSFWK